MMMAALMSNHYKQRPSELYRIRNDYASYCFDEAVWYFFALKKQEEDKCADGKAEKASAVSLSSEGKHYTNFKDMYHDMGVKV